MAFWADMAAVANDLLAEFGAPVTLRRRSGGTFDPVTGTATGETTTTLTTTGYVKPFRTDLIDGSRIQRGDRMLVLDDTQAPAMGDTVLIGTDYWHIIDIETTSGPSTPVCYFVHLRK